VSSVLHPEGLPLSNQAGNQRTGAVLRRQWRDAPMRRFGQARQAREIGLFGGLIKPFAANRLADLRFERESMTTDDPAYHR
jgi:hypothetical protein